MSLFENSDYQWRETYFVLFDEGSRPSADALKHALESVSEKYDVSEVREEEGEVASMTLISPYDFSAMDISFVSGEDVTSQVDELLEQINQADLTDEERQKLDRIPQFNARFDIYHFEKVMLDGGAEEDEFLDPGALLIVLEQLASLCHGVGVDPQSGSIM